MNAETHDTLPIPDALAEAVETMKVFCGMLLLSFAKHGTALRDTVIRNFIARGMACTESIHQVWRSGSEQDAWILHRALLDRLFHLHHLAQLDEFEVFEDYSFMTLFEARERLMADSDMRDKVPESLKVVQSSNRGRYDKLLAYGSRWRRPKAKEVAEAMGLGFLYRHGYDFGSTHVHPMASDGAIDFERLISPAHQQPQADPTVVKNSILVQSLLMQEGLNASTLRWRAIVYDFIEQVRRFPGDGNPDFRLTLYRISKDWPASELCQAPQQGDAA
jgi:hypothetical protein